ncbi:hypothetical protein D3C80_1861320 [compost metagenome]
MLPEKNIRIKKGKHPTVKTSKTVFRKLATIRLIATMDKLEMIPMKSTAPNSPVGLYPSPSAVQ